MSPRAHAAFVAAFVAVSLVFVRAAWVSDDAYISLRVIDNLLHGLGPRWNALERVQVYTHPLWLFLLAIPYSFSRESLWTVGLFGIAVTLVALGLCARRLLRRQGAWPAVALVVACALSRSVVSYASSGLENPLALLLLVLLVERSDPDRVPSPTVSVLLAALVGLTRIDLLLVAAPLVASSLRRVPLGVALRALVLGAAPLVGWELFSLVYYGALVPNTALAKLGTGITRLVLWKQGLRYFVALVRWDAFGAAMLGIGIGIGFARRRPLALGLVAYLGYIVWIGGDFMCGRFFFVPIVLAAMLAGERPWPPRTWLVPLALPLLVFVSVDSGPVRWLLAPAEPKHFWGIVDERGFYSTYTGLLDPRRPASLAAQKFARAGLDSRSKGVHIETCIGMVGYYAGHGVEIIDPMALGDPLLARLPIDDKVHFRIGHFERGLPEGYLETVQSGRNHIADPSLARYWDAIELVTRGPLWSSRRWRAIWALQTGALDPLRDAYVARREERLGAAASSSTVR